MPRSSVEDTEGASATILMRLDRDVPAEICGRDRRGRRRQRLLEVVDLS